MSYSNVRNGSTQDERRCFNRTAKVLLTFDDCAEPKAVDRYLAILRENAVHACFFLIGEWARDNPASVAGIRDNGHTLGNHSMTHRKLRSLPDEEVREEILNGVPSWLVRPPFGDCDDRVRSIAHHLGYQIALWTVDSEDWRGISSAMIRDRVTRGLRPGDCVLLHLSSASSLDALPDLIADIRSSDLKLSEDSRDLSLDTA
jgi:peptidoglycan/xylan/chitin deacetylase (PgdA/CDA1 family)